MSTVRVPPRGACLKKPRRLQRLQLRLSRLLSSKAVFGSHWS